MMQLYYVTPNDVGIMATDDGVSIQNAIDHASRTGLNKVVIPQNNMRTGMNEWLVSKSILLPSDIHLVLENCYLRMEQNIKEPVFRNKNLFGIFGSMKQGEQSNIVITGGKETMIESAEAHCFLFHNLQNLVLENFTCINHNENAMKLSFCHNVRLTNVHIKNEEKSQNGILVNGGCHQMIFENISGRGGCHLIKLETKPEPLEYVVFEQKTVISGVVISNIYGEHCKNECICLDSSSRIYHVVKDEDSVENIVLRALNEDNRFNIFNISISKISKH